MSMDLNQRISRVYQGAAIVSNFDNIYGQIRISLPVNEPTFFVPACMAIDTSEITYCKEHNYNSIDVMIGIDDQTTYKTINPVIKECFERFYNRIIKKIIFKDEVLYAGSGIILDSNYIPKLIIGKDITPLEGGLTRAEYKCKLHPDVFRYDTPIYRYIKNKIIPALLTTSWCNHYTYDIEINEDILRYIDKGVSIDDYLSTSSSEVLQQFLPDMIGDDRSAL